MCPSAVSAAIWLVSLGRHRKVTWFTGESNCSWKEHMGGGTTLCLKLVTRILSEKKSKYEKLKSAQRVRAHRGWGESLRIHLRRSRPRWRRRSRPPRGSAPSSSPIRRRSRSSRGSPRGAGGAARGPSRPGPELSEGLCRSPDSVSGTSGSFPPSTAGLQRENNEVKPFNQRFIEANYGYLVKVTLFWWNHYFYFVTFKTWKWYFYFFKHIASPKVLKRAL